MKKVIALISVLIFFTQILYSQIYYTDIPDTTIYMPSDETEDSTNYFYFDLNGDEIKDYYFYLRHFIYDYGGNTYLDGYVIGFSGTLNEVAIMDSYNDCPVLLNNGDTVNNHLLWSNYTSIFVNVLDYGQYCQSGTFYYALKFYFEGNYYFGWVKSLTTQNLVKVMEFAYNTIPNMPILAGQTEDLSSINTTDIENIKIYISSGVLNISNENHQDLIKEVRIYNQLGQEVKANSLNVYEAKIKINDLNAGLYIIKIITEEEISVSKYFFQ